jgi:glycosyltransferase involved in cell wall biosynthesis
VKRVRILHVVPTYLPARRYGGPIVAVHGLCRALVERGHRIEVFTTSIDGDKNSPVPHEIPVMLDGVIVRYFGSPVLRRLSWAPALASCLKREINGADVVHLHSVFLWPTWACARLAYASHIPYLISPRGMLVKKLIEARHKLLKSAWIGLIERSNIEKASAIHLTSKLEAMELSKFRWQLPRIEIVPNGAEKITLETPDSPSDDVKELVRAQPMILFLGRIASVKGLDRLLRGLALSRLGVLAIVGNDYEQLVPRLRGLAYDLNIMDRVHFLPRSISGVDKELVFASARVFVLTSYSESFGNSVLEAMQRRLPVIVTADVGAADIVRESGGGIVVAGEPAEIGRAIDEVLGSPALASFMGDAGQRHVVEYYGWPHIAARMEALYENLRA